MNKYGGLTNGKENDQMKHMYKNSLPTLQGERIQR
jgi:hypothetical protein